MILFVTGLLASDTLCDRAAVEDAYVKGLSKLHKMVLHVPDSTLG